MPREVAGSRSHEKWYENHHRHSKGRDAHPQTMYYQKGERAPYDHSQPYFPLQEHTSTDTSSSSRTLSISSPYPYSSTNMTAAYPPSSSASTRVPLHGEERDAIVPLGTHDTRRSTTTTRKEVQKKYHQRTAFHGDHRAEEEEEEESYRPRREPRNKMPLSRASHLASQGRMHEREENRYGTSGSTSHRRLPLASTEEPTRSSRTRKTHRKGEEVERREEVVVASRASPRSKRREGKREEGRSSTQKGVHAATPRRATPQHTGGTERLKKRHEPTKKTTREKEGYFVDSWSYGWTDSSFSSSSSFASSLYYRPSRSSRVPPTGSPPQEERRKKRDEEAWKRKHLEKKEKRSMHAPTTHEEEGKASTKEKRRTKKKSSPSPPREASPPIASFTKAHRPPPPPPPPPSVFSPSMTSSPPTSPPLYSTTMRTPQKTPGRESSGEKLKRESPKKTEVKMVEVGVGSHLNQTPRSNQRSPRFLCPVAFSPIRPVEAVETSSSMPSETIIQRHPKACTSRTPLAEMETNRWEETAIFPERRVEITPKETREKAAKRQPYGRVRIHLYACRGDICRLEESLGGGESGKGGSSLAGTHTREEEEEGFLDPRNRSASSEARVAYRQGLSSPSPFLLSAAHSPAASSPKGGGLEGSGGGGGGRRNDTILYAMAKTTVGRAETKRGVGSAFLSKMDETIWLSCKADPGEDGVVITILQEVQEDAGNGKSGGGGSGCPPATAVATNRSSSLPPPLSREALYSVERGGHHAFKKPSKPNALPLAECILSLESVVRYHERKKWIPLVVRHPHRPAEAYECGELLVGLYSEDVGDALIDAETYHDHEGVERRDDHSRASPLHATGVGVGSPLGKNAADGSFTHKGGPTTILSSRNWEERLTERVQEEDRLYREVHECALLHAPAELHRVDWWTGHYLSLPRSKWEKKRAQWEAASSVVSPRTPPPPPPSTLFTFPIRPSLNIAPVVRMKNTTTNTTVLPRSSGAAASLSRTTREGGTAMEDAPSSSSHADPAVVTTSSRPPPSQRSSPATKSVAVTPHPPASSAVVPRSAARTGRVCLHVLIKDVHSLRDTAGRPLRPSQVPHCQVALASESRRQEAFTTTQPYRGDRAQFGEEFTVLLGEAEERVCFAVTTRYPRRDPRGEVAERGGTHTLLGETSLGYFQFVPDQPTPLSLWLVKENPFPLSPVPRPTRVGRGGTTTAYSSLAPYASLAPPPPSPPLTTTTTRDYGSGGNGGGREPWWEKGDTEGQEMEPPVYGEVSLTGVLQITVYSSFVSPLFRVFTTTEAERLQHRVLVYLWYHLPQELYQLHPILGRLQGSERGLQELCEAARVVQRKTAAEKRIAREKWSRQYAERYGHFSTRAGGARDTRAPNAETEEWMSMLPSSSSTTPMGRRREMVYRRSLEEVVTPCGFRLHLYELQGLTGALAATGRRCVMEIQLGPFRYRTSILHVTTTITGGHPRGYHSPPPPSPPPSSSTRRGEESHDRSHPPDIRGVVPIQEVIEVWSYEPQWEPCTVVLFLLEEEDLPVPRSPQAWRRDDEGREEAMGQDGWKRASRIEGGDVGSLPWSDGRVTVEKEVARVVFGFGRMIRGKYCARTMMEGEGAASLVEPMHRTLSLTHEALTPHATMVPGEGLLLGVECLDPHFGWDASAVEGPMGDTDPGDTAYWTRRVESHFMRGGESSGKQAAFWRCYLHTAAYLVDCTPPTPSRYTGMGPSPREDDAGPLATLFPREAFPRSPTPRITSAPMTVKLLGIRNYRAGRPCQVCVEWMPLPKGYVPHADNTNPVIVESPLNTSKHFLISFASSSSSSSRHGGWRAFPTGHARAEHVEVASLQITVESPRRWSGMEVLGRVEVALSGLWKGEGNVLWLPFFSESEVVQKDPSSSSSRTSHRLHQGFPRSILPLGFVGVRLESIAFPRERGGSGDPRVPSRDMPGELSSSFSVARRRGVGITLEEEVYRDVATLLLRYKPSALPQLHSLVTSFPSLSDAHRSLRARFTPYPVAATFYLFVDIIDLCTKEGQEAERSGCVGIRVFCGPEETQCTRQEREIISGTETEEDGATRIFYPAIRIDVPLRPYTPSQDTSFPTAGRRAGEGMATQGGGSRVAGGHEYHEEEELLLPRPAVLGKALSSAPLRRREDAVPCAALYHPAYHQHPHPDPTLAASPFLAGGGGSSKPSEGQRTPEPWAKNLPPPPPRALPRGDAAVPPLVIELIGLQSQDADHRQAYHPKEHEWKTVGRAEDGSCSPITATAGEHAAMNARDGDWVEDMNWLPMYLGGGGMGSGMKSAGRSPPFPSARPLPPAPYHRGPLGEACLSVRPFLTRELYRMGDPITVPLIATKRVGGGSPSAAAAAAASGNRGVTGGNLATTYDSATSSRSRSRTSNVPPHSIAVGQVGTITFRVLPCAFDAGESDEEDYPAGVRMPDVFRRRPRGDGGRSGSCGPSPMQGSRLDPQRREEEKQEAQRDVDVLQYYEQRIRTRLHELGSAQQAIFHYLFYEGHVTKPSWEEELRHWLGSLTFPVASQ